MSLEVKRDGTVVELSPNAKIVQRSRTIIVMDGNVAFQILNRGSRRRARVLAEYHAQQKTEPEIVEHDTEAETQSIQESLENLEDPVTKPPAIPIENESSVETQAEDPWIPDPNDWFDCRIKTSNASRNFVILIVDGVNETAFSNGNAFSRSPAAHSYCLERGTPCMARLARTATGLRALEVVVEHDDDYTGREDEAVIRHWSDRNNIGSGERSCQCGIMLVGDYEGLPFAVGDKVRGEYFLNKKGNWALRNLIKV